ncbi:MAG: hypothetical protein JSW62_00575, partial [Thermoplasmatales archaeon]
RDKKANKKRNQFIKKIEKIVKCIENDEPKMLVDKLLIKTKESLSILPVEDENVFNKKITELEKEIRNELKQIEKKYWLKIPRSLAFSEEIVDIYDIYLNDFEHLKNKFFLPTSKKIDELFDEKIKETNLKFDPRARIEQSIMELIDQQIQEHDTIIENFIESFNRLSEKISNLKGEISSDIEKLENRIKEDIQKIPEHKLKDKNEFISARDKLETEIVTKIEHLNDMLETVSFQLDRITWSKIKGEELISEADFTASLEQEILSYKEKEELDLELIQLGMALGVIHHEFTGTVKNIRRNIRRLKAWADVNEELQPIYKNLRANFEHLDGYLTLFTPLSRRLYRNEVEITGNGIKQFLEDVFEEKFEKNDIDFNPTEKFLQKKIIGYPSTFYPVFINLIDNALFWLKDSKKPREIILDADQKGYFVSNNGPPISKMDRKIIFEYGFSRKPNGRGMGLYISREILSKIGYTIYLLPKKEKKGVTFRIEKI